MLDDSISAKRHMQYSFLRTKLTGQRALVEVAALLFVLSAVVLAGYALDLNQEESKQPGEAGEQVTGKPLGAAFLRDTKEYCICRPPRVRILDFADVRFGSLAALDHYYSSTAASGRIAVVRQPFIWS